MGGQERSRAQNDAVARPTMKLTGNCAAAGCTSHGGSNGGGGGGGGAVVVVGVKMDSRSKELLTWALVKVAQTGDRIIALHVLDPDTGANLSLA